MKLSYERSARSFGRWPRRRVIAIAFESAGSFDFFSTSAVGIFRDRIFADLTVYTGDGATNVYKRVHLYGSFSVNAKARRSVRQQLRFRNTETFEGWSRREQLLRRCAACSRSSGLGLYLVVIAGLFPNIVAKCGRACRRRWFEAGRFAIMPA